MKQLRHSGRIHVSLLLGLLLVGAETLYSQGYGGPSVLSRGGNRSGQRGRAPVDFTYYVGVRGFAESGLTAVSVDEVGEVERLNAYGTQIEAGLYGAKSWRRSLLGVDYRGDYRKSFTTKRFDGTNQALSLDFETRLNRRTVISLRQSGGTSNRAFGGFIAPAFSELDRLGVPTNEVFDSRSYFSQTGAVVAWQKSARLAFAGNVDAFFTKRSNRSLIGTQGFRTGGQFEYRFSARTSAGAGYNFSKYEYPRIFGGSSVNTVQAALRRSIGRDIELTFIGGVNRIDSTGSQSVVLSPEIAAILGRGTGVETFRRIAYSPQVQATVRYLLERSSLTAGYTSGVNPGNGVYATSSQNALRFGYSFAGIRNVSLAASAGYSQNKSVGLDLRDYKSFQAGGGLSRKLGRNLNFSSQIDYRTFSAGTLRGRQGFFVTLGLALSPSRLPLAIW